MKSNIYLILDENNNVICECHCMYDAEMIVRNNPKLSWIYIKEDK